MSSPDDLWRNALMDGRSSGQSASDMSRMRRCRIRLSNRPGSSVRSGAHMIDNNAFQEGYEAYSRHLGLDANPYPGGTEESNAWRLGWLKAEQEHEKEVAD